MNDQEIEKTETNPEESKHYSYFANVLMNGVGRPYYFGTEDDTLEVDEAVIVETVTGYELGKIVDEPRSTSEYNSSIPLKGILRRANANDFRMREHYDSRVEEGLKICDEEAKNLSLTMRFLTLHYSVDGAKCTITYSSDGRVDFRELLKVLAPKLNARIDLRQVAPRDRAKSVGGVGICGLPLCCTSFLTHFDVISISKAKNQMLSLNIPKLSGACGKLMCCLAFEDEMYTQEKEKFPKVGTIFNDGKHEYKVDSINILSRTVKLVSNLDTKFVTLDEYAAMTTPRITNKDLPLPQITPRNNKQSNPSNNSRQDGHQNGGGESLQHHNHKSRHRNHRNRNKGNKGKDDTQ